MFQLARGYITLIVSASVTKTISFQVLMGREVVEIDLDRSGATEAFFVDTFW